MANWAYIVILKEEKTPYTKKSPIFRVGVFTYYISLLVYVSEHLF